MDQNQHKTNDIEGPICPVPLPHKEKIVMGHGSGGKMSQNLITNLFLPPFDNPILRAGDDAGIVQIEEGVRLAISTDSHVVWPLFFPGGDIGRLAICGTVNDISMMGAKPLYLTAGFVLEEGLDFNILEEIVTSMHKAAIEASIQIVAGDTKVVQRGKADGLYINTTGVGLLKPGIKIAGANARPGDKIILSGTLGDHAIAVLSARGELGFESDIQSDIAPLNNLVAAMLETSNNIHVLRDPTRGGLATSLNEIAQQSQVGMIIHENRIPLNPSVNAACELLGYDPLYMANEGKLIAIVDPEDADNLITKMRNTPLGENAVVIGDVTDSHPGRLLMKTSIGSTRVVDVLAGEILPRIC